MNQISRNRLLLFVAFFHLLADVAFAGGAVLCVGPDEHRAVESQYLADSGCLSEELGSPYGAELSAEASDSEDCTDSPLHSEAELASSAEPLPDVQDTPAAFATPPIGEVVDAIRLRARARAPAISPGLRAHRTVVLII